MPSPSQLLLAITALIGLLGQVIGARAASELIERKSATHWAFQPVAKPDLPEVTEPAWAKDPLDHFILAKLESQGLRPSPVAARRTLVRRAYLTLTGLQPSYDQTQAFINDDSPDAYAKLVDELLASRQYGERWARHWLDVARYADTKGYVFQEARQYPYAYTFRDWVIRSLNADMPYDEFLKYQIAADKIVGEDGDRDHLAAMGFLTVGRRFLNRQPDIIDDRIDVVTRGTMALTVACSRCHDHKYDPIPTADYYSLYGVFASSQEPKELPLLGDQPVTPETEKFERELISKRAKVDEFLQKRLDDQREEQQLKKYLLAINDSQGMADADAKKLASSRGLVQELLLRWRKHVDGLPADDPIFAPWKACSDLAPETFAAEAPQRLAPILASPALNPRVALALRDGPPDSADALASAYAKLFSHDNRTEAHEKPEREQIRLVLHAPGNPNDIPLGRLYKLLPTPDQEHVRKLRRDVAKHETEAPGAPPRGMVMTDRERPVEPYIFIRGQQGNRGPEVPRQFPQIIAGPDRQPFPADSSGRLEMAQSIASQDNPLTARVIVNRVWLQHFGSPLVSTPSDFGLRSDPPSHPELLDHLAHQFVEGGWSLKSLHRHMLLSATYQQSSDHDPDKAASDPENQLFWRMNRQRLDFESMRDSLIQASGRLEATMFGRPYPISKQPFVTRRTIYSEVQRQNLESVFRTFDFASPDAHCPQRFETTVPQQALFMMNSPFIEELSGSIANSAALQSQAPDDEKIRHLYRQIFARDPDPRELQMGREFIAAPSTEEAPETPWSYGYGSLQNDSVAFTKFPVHSRRGYHGGDTLPDPTTGWAHLHQSGGHPGHGPNLHAILRFTAPETTRYSLESKIGLAAQMSDGIIINAIANGTRLVSMDIPPKSERKIEVGDIQLEKGATLDLVVACGGTDSHDSFSWNPSIRSADQSWSYTDDFSQPKVRPTPWQTYAQALLSTNEFAFVD